MKAVLEKNPSGSLSQDVHRPLERRENFGGKNLKWWQVIEANNPMDRLLLGNLFSTEKDVQDFTVVGIG